MIQEFINKHFYNLYIISLIFAIVTYGLIDFKSIDELCVVALFLLCTFYVFHTKDWNVNKISLYIFSVFLFYLLYSFYIHSNSKKAIIVDFIIQLKPYIAFFCAYHLRPHFSDSQKKLLREISIVCWYLLLPFGLISIFYPDMLYIVANHPSNYAAAITAIALTFLLSSSFSKKDKILFIIMLAVGLFSERSKFYGFFVFSAFVTFFFSNAQNIKLNFKNVVILLLMLIAIGIVAKSKIEYYFLQNLSPDTDLNEAKNSIARFVLYATSWEIFQDYMPFGSGFATFGTHASAAYYSPLYKEYGIDTVWGLSKSYPYFISDTYYPSLAQFGVVGVILFAVFWLYLCLKAYKNFRQTNNAQFVTIIIIITGYFAIENIADATFTSNRGYFFMLLLGLIFSEMKQFQHSLTSKEKQ